MRGRLIVIEGVDGSGKETQTRLLCDRLQREGKNPLTVSFPDYQSPSSALVKMYLAGEFGGEAADVSPRVASCFYALDRYASYHTKWGKDYERGSLILADRYTTSNMVHQASKIIATEEKDRFLDWLWDFEYRICGLPQPDCVVFLDMPPELALSLTEERNNKITGEKLKDIHELDRSHLMASYTNAKYAAQKYGWETIPCAEGGQVRSREEIAAGVYAIVAKALDKTMRS